MLNSLVVKSILDKKIESGCGSDGYMTKENPTGTGSLSMNRHPTANIGANSTAEGFKCEASGASSHAEGNSTTASGQASHAEGKSTKASGDYSHAEGVNTKASSYYSHAEGFKCEASGYYSHAEGSYTTASASSSHAEGTSCLATAQASHAEGNATTASEHDSHAEGDTTTASGQASHAEGFKTKASGPNSHAEGVNTEASGYYSHAEGLETKASGSYSHSGGNSTIAGYSSQTAIGEYNENKEEDIFEVGNGTSKTARSNALELTKTGDLKIGGNYIDGSGNVLSMGSANEYTDQKIADLINGAPTTLDTLKEIADAMAENQDVVKALDESIGTKANSSDLTDHTGNTNNPHNVTAEQTPYDPTESGLSAQNVQDAVDEVNSDLYLKSISVSIPNDKTQQILTQQIEVPTGYEYYGIDYPEYTTDIFKNITPSYDENTGTVSLTKPNNSYGGETMVFKTKVWFTQKATKIKAIDELNSNFNNLEIGGRNLYYLKYFDSLSKKHVSSWSISDGEITLVASGDDIFIGEILNSGNSWNESRGPLMDIEGAKYVTISISNPLFTKNYYNFLNSEKKALSNFKLFTNSSTIEVPDGAKYLSIRVGYENSVSGTEYKLRIKVEKGNKPTDWTPAPEDIETEIQSVEKQVTVNLLKSTLETTTKNGVTCTNNGDGTYTINGTNTNSWNTFPLCFIKFDTNIPTKSANKAVQSTNLVFFTFIQLVYTAIVYNVVSVDPIIVDAISPILLSTP